MIKNKYYLIIIFFTLQIYACSNSDNSKYLQQYFKTKNKQLLYEYLNVNYSLSEEDVNHLNMYDIDKNNKLSLLTFMDYSAKEKPFYLKLVDNYSGKILDSTKISNRSILKIGFVDLKNEFINLIIETEFFIIAVKKIQELNIYGFKNKKIFLKYSIKLVDSWLDDKGNRIYYESEYEFIDINLDNLIDLKLTRIWEDNNILKTNIVNYLNSKKTFNKLDIK